jgi:hypothetical protein
MASTSTASPKAPLLLPCPHCGKETDSLKDYHVLHSFLFLLLVYQVSHRRYVACPFCMREYLMQRMGINLLTANFVFPFSAGPWLSILLARSFTKGHSEPVLDRLREAKRKAMAQQQLAAQRAKLAPKPPLPNNPTPPTP